MVNSQILLMDAIVKKTCSDLNHASHYLSGQDGVIKTT